MVPSHLISPETFTSDDHTELISHAYATDDESLLTGVWECAPCKVEIDAYPVHEMMTVLDGSVTVTDADGNAETYEAGDSFFIPKGTPCTWEITKKLRKFYMIAA
jgi:uncharacterized cupin superfamily protein